MPSHLNRCSFHMSTIRTDKQDVVDDHRRVEKYQHQNASPEWHDEMVFMSIGWDPRNFRRALTVDYISVYSKIKVENQNLTCLA